MDDILIRNASAILPGENGAEGKSCSIAVKDGCIRAILPADASLPAAETVDARGRLLTPGLVNAHTHAYMTGMRCWADDLSFDDWLFGRVMPKEDALTPQDAYWFSLLACLEMLSGGVTAFLDMHMFPGAAPSAVPICQELKVAVLMDLGLFLLPDTSRLKSLFTVSITGDSSAYLATASI